jgi:hypothetical protein
MDEREKVLGAGDNVEFAEAPAPEARKKSPLSGMRLLIAAAAIVIAAAALLYFTQGGEKELSRDEFKALLGSKAGVAVVQDLGAIPPGNASARLNAQNCGIQLSFTLSSLGKNVSNYAFDGGQCFGGASSSARAISDCLAEIRSESRLPFYIEFNSTLNRTRFAASGAHYSGDSTFLGDCSITGLVR